MRGKGTTKERKTIMPARGTIAGMNKNRMTTGMGHGIAAGATGPENSGPCAGNVRMYNPTLVFLNCDDSKVSGILNQLKGYGWVKYAYPLTGKQEYRIALHVDTITDYRKFEEYKSILEKIDGVQSVSEYPAYRYTTNGVKRGDYPHSAYFFLKGKSDLHATWEKIRHSEHLVELHEVPGDYDFIMYAEAKTHEDLLNHWWNLSRSGMFSEIESSFALPANMTRSG